MFAPLRHPASYSGRLLLFDGLEGSFRSIKLRGRQEKCCVCGDQPSITKLIDYEQFCGTKATDKVMIFGEIQGFEK